MALAVLRLRMFSDEKSVTELITDHEAGLTKKYDLNSEQIRRIAKQAFHSSTDKTIKQVFEESGV